MTPSTRSRKLRSYRPGDRGPRNPITPAQVAAAREYRALGMAWHRVGRVLGVGAGRIRKACLSGQRSPIGADPTQDTNGARSWL